jgi:hypothetical protein
MIKVGMIFYLQQVWLISLNLFLGIYHANLMLRTRCVAYAEHLVVELD